MDLFDVFGDFLPAASDACGGASFPLSMSADEDEGVEGVRLIAAPGAALCPEAAGPLSEGWEEGEEDAVGTRAYWPPRGPRAVGSTDRARPPPAPGGEGEEDEEDQSAAKGDSSDADSSCLVANTDERLSQQADSRLLTALPMLTQAVQSVIYEGTPTICNTVATTPQTMVHPHPRTDTAPLIGAARAAHTPEADEGDAMTLTAVPEPRL
jgi:hypothetical protein